MQHGVRVFIRLKGVIVFRELHRKHFHADRTGEICFMREFATSLARKSIWTPSREPRKVKGLESVIKRWGIFAPQSEGRA